MCKQVVGGDVLKLYNISKPALKDPSSKNDRVEWKWIEVMWPICLFLKWYWIVGGKVVKLYKIAVLSHDPVAKNGKFGWKVTQETQSVWCVK